MIFFIRKNKRFLCWLFLFTICIQIVSPTASYALTTGPTLPEVQSFKPAGVSDMVDLFSGDFSYNVPLFELPGPNGGYPFNLAYQSGIGMDQEASWVGLGWNLQPGAITRQMRGLPDEFDGDEVKTKMSIAPNITVGVGGGLGTEAFGGVTVGLGLSYYYNNYRGAGYTIDANVGYTKTMSGQTGSLGLGYSLDSQQGSSLTPSLSLKGEMGEFGVTGNYHSRKGLTSVSYDQTINTTINGKGKANEKGERKEKIVPVGINQSSEITFSHPGYTPQVTMAMKNFNVSATFKVGGDFWGIFGNGYVKGFYNEQRLDRDNQEQTHKAFGYLNFQNAGEADLQDYNRQGDGLITMEQPNLPTPTMTYDVYNVMGQGISMMYKPVRNDYGMIYDQRNESSATALGVGIDAAPSLNKAGVNLSVNHATSVSGRWSGPDGNGLASYLEYPSADPAKNPLFEPWYFKVHGETTSESTDKLKAIGGEKPVRADLNGFEVNQFLVNKDIQFMQAPPKNAPVNARQPRNNVVTPITNGALIDASGKEAIPTYQITYYNGAAATTETPFTRQRPDHHFAGYTALSPDGLRYVYALPAYNNHQEDVSFSTQKVANENRVAVTPAGDDPSFRVAGTDQYLKKTTLPAFAHSFLLTAIVGPDYVDLTNNGVTNDDLGYWVRFIYRKTSDNYQWRDPFSKAHLQDGYNSDTRDDKGSFIYGTKEIWYLAKAETKSHIAEFFISPRQDGRGVGSKFQNAPHINLGELSYQLNRIELYTREGRVLNKPLKTVKFGYDYLLCKGIENAPANTGKLTLTSLSFDYGGVTRAQSPIKYDFLYNNQGTDGIGYDSYAVDRWGNYKPYPPADPLYNRDFPYAKQDGKTYIGEPDDLSINKNAAAWSLKEILLPSGGKIMVDYESDDYAYVQNRPAMQMVTMISPAWLSSTPTGSADETFELTESSRVYFRINVVPKSSLTGDALKAFMANEVKKYIDTETWQVYFKVKMKLVKNAPPEYITGYADIDQTQEMGLARMAQQVGDDYTLGYFHLKKEFGENPIAVRAWQHLRVNQPDLMNKSMVIYPGTSPKDIAIKNIRVLMSIAGELKTLFSSFYRACDDAGWGENVYADKSWVRLNCHDKIKMGGGLRVKQITIKDGWGDFTDANNVNKKDIEGVYGQTYSYRTTDEAGNEISSGVAAYEPFVGGEENSVHYAKRYTESIPLQSSNNLFFEYPINEAYYPGPQVGYSKVTVRSLASASAANKPVLNADGVFPTVKTFGTSGVTVHEFYTAKDFPVITDETDKINNRFRGSVPIPCVGNITINQLTAVQGYSIIVNDMHGKLRKVSNYRQNNLGVVDTQPISWVQYNYLSEARTANGKTFNKLTNAFKHNGDGTLSAATKGDLANGTQTYYMAQEVDFFHDMRQFRDNMWEGGVKLDLDVVYVMILGVPTPIPVPMSWPNIGYSHTQLRTSVSNKIIFRSGVLQSTTASDGSSVVTTTNEKWNMQTGHPVLTKTTNNFDNPVFNYSIPAFTQYAGMGAAYKNIGLMFDVSSVQDHPTIANRYIFHTDLGEESLHPGDEFLIYNYNRNTKNPIGRVVYLGRIEGDEQFYSTVPLAERDYRCMIVRSGYRNHLSVMAGSVTALKDPSLPGETVTYTKRITVPK